MWTQRFTGKLSHSSPKAQPPGSYYERPRKSRAFPQIERYSRGKRAARAPIGLFSFAIDARERNVHSSAVHIVGGDKVFADQAKRSLARVFIFFFLAQLQNISRRRRLVIEFAAVDVVGET